MLDHRLHNLRNSVPKILCDDKDYAHLQPVIDSLPNELSTQEHDAAVCFVQEYSHVFSMSEFDLGRTSLITYHFDTGDARPI